MIGAITTRVPVKAMAADMETTIVMSASLNLPTIVTPTAPLAMETLADAMAKVLDEVHTGTTVTPVTANDS